MEKTSKTQTKKRKNQSAAANILMACLDYYHAPVSHWLPRRTAKRSWTHGLKAYFKRSREYLTPGKQEAARRRRQIERGMLRVENGLEAAV